MMPYLHLIKCITKDWIYKESAEINPVRKSIMRISHLPSIHRSFRLPKHRYDFKSRCTGYSGFLD